jgi:hypothetical protein
MATGVPARGRELRCVNPSAVAVYVAADRDRSAVNPVAVPVAVTVVVDPRPAPASRARHARTTSATPEPVISIPEPELSHGSDLPHSAAMSIRRFAYGQPRAGGRTPCVGGDT